MRQFTEDGRFALFPNSSLADLAVDKKIGSNVASRFLKRQNAWIGIGPNNGGISFLRKVDASLDAELLEKWCQVVTRGELDEGGRYRKLDEATWESQRQELAHDLDANPDAEVLRSAVADRHYWLREEIKQSKPPIPLYDRLIAAEPTWQHYSGRAKAHFDVEHWDLAARDELEAARLRGDRYWLRDSPITGLTLGVRLVQAPGRPREQYELALRWFEARDQAGASGGTLDWIAVNSSRTSMFGLAQFRLGQYSDALATLRQRDDVPMLSQVAGTLMSPWNLLTFIEREAGPYPSGLTMSADHWQITTQFTFYPMDLAVRAMCHYHLGRPKEAEICLRLTRELLGKEARGLFGEEGGSVEQKALLQEAELLIEGKAKP